jgi:hypothetical protein
MCHLCLGAIISRRARAEKRIKEKATSSDKGTRSKSSLSSKEGFSPAASVYNTLASRGQEVSELTELLTDARGRLKELLATQRINLMRRRMIDQGSQRI